MSENSWVRLDDQDIACLAAEIVPRIQDDAASAELLVRRPGDQHSLAFMLLTAQVTDRQGLEDDVPVVWTCSYLESFPEVYAGNGAYRRVVTVGEFLNINDETLLVSEMVLGRRFRGRGIGTALYRRLEPIARANRYRYIVGYSSSDSTRRYFMGRGRYGSWELLPESRGELRELYSREGSSGSKFTVSFLDPDDVNRHVRPSCRRHRDAAP